MIKKYNVVLTSKIKKQLKTIKKRSKDLNKLDTVVNMLAEKRTLPNKYKDHQLINFDNKNYKNCRECHIEPNWLLIYKYNDKDLILLLIETGSHSDLFE